MKYLNFELSVDVRSDGAFEVRSRSPSGEARCRLNLSLDAGELLRQRGELEQAIEHSRADRGVVRLDGASPPRRLASAERLGTALFTALLNGKVLERYRASLAVADTKDAGLRIQLRLEPPEIAALPWEFMYDPDDGSFVSLNPNTPVVRYPEIDLALKPLAIKPPLRILGLIASPSDLPKLDMASEVRRIEEGLAELRAKGDVVLHWVESGAFHDLQAALPRQEWHVLHFIGHGGVDAAAAHEGFLAFENEVTRPGATSGGVRKVAAATFGRVLRGYPSLRLIVLNSCLGARASDADAFSSVAATLVRKGVPAVVAMQYEISDQAAIAFAHAFYASLAAGIPVDRAVADARCDLSAQREDSLEWGTPVLLMRAPEGTLFTGPATEVTTGSRGRLQPPKPPPPPRPPVPWGMGVVGALAPAVLAAGLGAWPAPNADMTLDAEVTGVTVRLAEDWPLPDAMEVTRLGASGLRWVTVSSAGGGRPSVESDAVQFRGLDEGDAKGRLTLDLRAILPPGATFGLSVADSGYALKADSLPGFTVPTSGPVQMILPGLANDRVDFGESGSVDLRSGGRSVRVDFIPAPGTRDRFAGPLPLDRLDLTRVDQYRTGGRTEPRIVSTVRAGTLTVSGAGSRPLAEREELHASSIRGEVTGLDLAGDHLRLQLVARVKGLTSGPQGGNRSLMPSLLSWTVIRHPMVVVGALGLYLAALALAIRRRMARPR